jgi:hypothetical protein
MKFIRREHTITTIFDKELTEEEDIQIVLKNLYDHRIEFSMDMKKYEPANYNYVRMHFEKVRIKKIHDDKSLDLIVFKSGSTVKMSVLFEDIVEVNATTKKYKVLDVSLDVTRWDLLDLREE